MPYPAKPLDQPLTAADEDKPQNPYTSPTLVHLKGVDVVSVPLDDVACRDCPASIWYWQGAGELFCFCSAMHRHTWGGKELPVRLCDAREQAVAKVIERLASQRP